MFIRKKRAWASKNGDFVAIAVLSGLITFFIYVAVTSSDTPPGAKPFNFGFNPALICEPIGLGDPVCVPRR